MPEFKLAEEIIKRSQSQTWGSARLDLRQEDVYLVADPETCLCGHTPIKEICTLRNTVNGQSADVGNCCVKKFLGLPSDKIFQAVKRIKVDSDKALNAEAIEHAHQKGWINDWERKFSLDTVRKRVLTGKQLQKRREVNARVLDRMSGRKKAIGAVFT
jgi:hypothetical protein